MLVAFIIVFTSGLLIYQTGTILQDSDKYLDRMSQLLTDATSAVGGEHFLETIRTIEPQAVPSEPTLGGGAAGAGVGMGMSQSRSQPGDETKESPKAYWDRFLRSNLSVLGGWLVSGIGGLVGAIGAAVICLSFLFYLLETRAEWIERLIRILGSLGFRPRRDCLPRIQHAITTFTGFVAMISVIGATVIGTTAWLLGLPQPFLWGLIFGLLEFVPYFGPMIGGSLLVLVALATGSGGWWPPLLMLGVLLVWLTLEGYVISPMIYGRAVEFDPVMVLVAILFFGWLWGPLGMITALPTMVILRELVVMRPDTPALDALMKPEGDAKNSPAKTI